VLEVVDEREEDCGEERRRDPDQRPDRDEAAVLGRAHRRLIGGRRHAPIVSRRGDRDNSGGKRSV
jgi:hypothetical protein